MTPKLREELEKIGLAQDDIEASALGDVFIEQLEHLPDPFPRSR
jgi:hypothetical protein